MAPQQSILIELFHWAHFLIGESFFAPPVNVHVHVTVVAVAVNVSVFIFISVCFILPFCLHCFAFHATFVSIAIVDGTS